MNYVGLIFEFLFLAGGVYLYLLTRGLIKTKESIPFVEENKILLRFASLALIAIMLLNISLHIRDLLG
jgi:hypothetical protein